MHQNGLCCILSLKVGMFCRFYVWTEVKIMKMYSGNKQDEAVASFCLMLATLLDTCCICVCDLLPFGVIRNV